MSLKEVTIILIGGPAHGQTQVFQHSLANPIPERVNVKLPMTVGGTGSPQAFYRVSGLKVEDEPAVVGVYEPLGPELAWPIAIVEVLRFRQEQGSQFREIDEEPEVSPTSIS